MSAIQDALELQGISAAWRGPMPTDPNQLTAEYLDELIDGHPRMNAGDKNSANVDLQRLKTNFTSLLVKETAKALAKQMRDEELDEITADEELRLLAEMAASEIDDYVDQEMTGVPLKAQVHFKKLTKMIAVLARDKFSDL